MIANVNRYLVTNRYLVDTIFLFNVAKRNMDVSSGPFSSMIYDYDYLLNILNIVII